jgi:NTP pyrophosphatase (non-canonical NTP hydrolase)
MTALSDNILASSYKDFDYYAKQAIRTMAFYRNNDEKILNAALGLAGEAGEIVETIKKVRHHGHPFTDEVRKALLKEVGDIFWYCAEMADALDEPLSAIAAGNIKKLAERYPEGFSSERSLNRPETYEGDVRSPNFTYSKCSGSCGANGDDSDCPVHGRK